MPRDAELAELWARGMELTETRRIDTYEYRKAVYTLHKSTTAEQMLAVIEWLEQQPEWTDEEFHLPACFLEELRDQQQLERDAKAYKKRSEINGSERNGMGER